MGNQVAFAAFCTAARARALAVCLALCTLVMGLSASDHESTIITFDPPGAILTIPTSITPAGVIAGNYETQTL